MGLNGADTPRSLGALFLAAAGRFPSRPALEVEDAQVTYGELALAAGRIAALLSAQVAEAQDTETWAAEPQVAGRQVAEPQDAGRRVAETQTHAVEARYGAVLAARSAVAYQGVLGTLLSGAAYVPLNPKFPASRNAHMLEVSGATTLIVDRGALAQLDAVLAPITRSLAIVLPSEDDVAAIAARFPQHRIFGARELAALSPIMRAPDVSPARDPAYLLFTSGTTGLPKGVMVSHANVLHHLTVMWDRYAITPEDRFSQSFDLTFDLSVFDLFAAWGRGACVVVIPQKQLMAPHKIIKDKALTIWFSVPSVGMSLRTLRILKPGAFPSLRWSLFCGERLPAEIAEAWQEAAPNSIVENLYGPTEVTIACTLYRWDRARSREACAGGVVPIGRPYEGMSAAIVGEDLRRLPDGERGELCMRGPQVSLGYFRDAEKTRERFVAMPWFEGEDNRWYRTGDLAYVDAAGDLIHCGRNDEQVKLRGFRVELGEVEHVVRAAAGTDFVAVVPYPRNEHGPTGLTAVVAKSSVAPEAILEAARAKLADYMVPESVERIEEMPLNVNGKIDKKALLHWLEERRCQGPKK